MELLQMLRYILAVFLYLPVVVQAVDITFTGDGQIGTGDAFGYAYVYDTPPRHTTVTMTGGQVAQVAQHDASVFEMSDGYAKSVYTADASTANIRGGLAPMFYVTNDSTVNLYDGEIASFEIYSVDNSTVNVLGGHIIHQLTAVNNATMNLRGGLFADEGYGPPLLTARDSAKINLFGSGILYDPTTSDSKPYPTLTGSWLDGNSFLMSLYDAETYQHIRFVPEPTSLALLVFGGTIMVRRWG